MFDIVPYWCRIVLLLILMAAIAAIDRLRNRQQATKWKEYGFVVLAGVVGAAFGLVNDLITSSISPEYFVFGKGLAAGAGLTIRAGILGMKAGFSAGAVAGAVCLYASTRNRSRPPLAYRKLLGLLWRPVVLAVTSGATLAILFHGYDPLGFSPELNRVLDSREVARFFTAWWVHCGVYVGLLLGVVWIVVDIGRFRNRRLPA